MPIPDTWSIGSFLASGPCLIFKTSDGSAYRPILPEGSAVREAGSSSTVRIGTKEVRLGERVKLAGGESEYGAPSAADAPSCPNKTFIAGEIL